MLVNRRILLIISGGIAAFKSLDLIRRMRERGASVTPVMTAAAAEFVTPLSVSALAGQKVYQDLFNLTDESEMGHIELSRSADLIVVAPASADLMAKMTTGLANDLASTLLLATDTPVLIAPAMNVRMWDHPATQRNIATLRADGIRFVGPNEGDMACGEYGPGRMAEPMEILAAIEQQFLQMDGARPLNGKRILVTSGPTHEPIDPVRYIANRSSGAQGTAIAQALVSAGAEVNFVTGPAAVAPPIGAKVTQVQTAKEMLEAVRPLCPVTWQFLQQRWQIGESLPKTGQKSKKRRGNYRFWNLRKILISCQLSPILAQRDPRLSSDLLRKRITSWKMRAQSWTEKAVIGLLQMMYPPKLVLWGAAKMLFILSAKRAWSHGIG